MQLSSQFLQRILKGWYLHRISWHSAALAYYALFSFIPIAILFLTISSQLIGPSAIKGNFETTLSLYVAPSVASIVQNIIVSSYTHSSFSLSALFNVGLLLWASTNVINSLRQALHQIWELKPTRSSSFINFLWARILTLLVIVLLFLVLIFSAFITATFTAISSHLSLSISLGSISMIQIIEIFISFIIATSMLTIMYQILSDYRLSTSAVFQGSLYTSALLMLSKLGVGWYLGKSNITNAFGASGSIVAFLLWIYFTSEIILIGALIIKSFSPNRK